MFHQTPSSTTPTTPGPARARRPGARCRAFASAGGRGFSRRESGSILVLAVVVLVMIALLGIAFVQQAKFDRYATSRYERKFIPLVINGVIADMRTKLTDDVDKNIDAKVGLYDYPWTDHGQTKWQVTDGKRRLITVDGAPKDQPRDDKYLASTAPLVTGNSNTSVTWGHLSNLDGIWLDLPKLGGSRSPSEHPITGPRGDNDGSDTMVTGGYLKASAGGNYDPRGFDADGDGVLDSRWTWVPPDVRDFGGRRYVMAVRLVDLDALINANVATANTTDGTDATMPAAGAGNLPTGYTPAGVDLSRLLARALDAQDNTTGALTGTSTGYWKNDLGNLLGFRFKVNPSNLPPKNAWPYNFDQREEVWKNQARLYGFTEGRYAAADELELRHKAGLNDSDYTAAIEDDDATPPANGMPHLTRNQPTPNPPEGSAMGVAGDAGGDLHQWFHGGQAGDPIANRKFPDVRHMLTTVSGTADYQPNYGEKGNGGPSATNAARFKYDLNHHKPGKDPYTEVTDRLTRAMGANGARHYLQDQVSPTTLTEQVIPEYALNILDYADDDYIPTAKDGRIGFERLPFLREAYFQVLYEERDGTNADNDNNADTTGSDPFDKWFALDGDSDPPSGWSAQHKAADTRAVAIEIANPFAHKMEADKLKDNVRVVIKTGDKDGATVSKWTFGDGTSMKDLGPRADTGANKLKDTLILWSPPEKPEDAKETGSGVNGQNMDAKLGFQSSDAVKVKLGDGTLKFKCDNQNIVVEMQVKLADGSWVTYDRMNTGRQFPDSKATSSGGDTNQDISMAQRDASRYSKNIQYVGAVPAGGSLGRGSAAPTDPENGGNSFDKNAADLAKDDKKNSPTNPFATFDPDNGLQLPHPDRVSDPDNDRGFHSLAELGWMCMVGFSPSQTLSQRLTDMAQNQPQRMFLDLRSSREVSGFPDGGFPVGEAPPDTSGTTGGGSGLPFAAMVLDQFSVNSPRYDKVDEDNDDGDNNDNTGKDNQEELKTPGTININTATLPVLTLASPLPEQMGDTEDLMRAIVAYRDQPIVQGDTNAPSGGFDAAAARDPSTATPKGVVTNRKGFPGIASMGELLFVNPLGAPPTPSSPNDTSASDAHNMQALGYNGGNDNNSVYDTYPAADDADSSDPGDFKTTDDAEEKLARWQFLSQAFSTRSDVYAAYVTIRGYKDNDFKDGPVETARFIVIFDRSNLKDDDASAKVIAYRRYQ